MSDIVYLDQFRMARPSAFPAHNNNEAPVHPRANDESRRGRWRAAEYTVTFYRKLRDLAMAADMALRIADLPAAKQYANLDDESRVFNQQIISVARLLLTPAPGENELKQKRKLCEGWLFRFPEQLKQIEKVIAEDEAWLRVNGRKGRRSAVQS